MLAICASSSTRSQRRCFSTRGDGRSASNIGKAEASIERVPIPAARRASFVGPLRHARSFSPRARSIRPSFSCCRASGRPINSQNTASRQSFRSMGLAATFRTVTKSASCTRRGGRGPASTGAEFAVGDPVYREWRAGRGMYLSNGAAVAFSLRSKVARDSADLFVMALLTRFSGYFSGYSDAIRASRGDLTFAVLKAHTENRGGRVALASADPRDPPLIDFHGFEEGTDRKGEDLTAVVDGIKRVRRMAAAIEPDVLAPEDTPGAGLNDDESLKRYIREHAWGHHASCTCPIGPPERLGVVDSDFRVHGTSRPAPRRRQRIPSNPRFFHRLRNLYDRGEGRRRHSRDSVGQRDGHDFRADFVNKIPRQEQRERRAGVTRRICGPDRYPQRSPGPFSILFSAALFRRGGFVVNGVGVWRVAIVFSGLARVEAIGRPQPAASSPSLERGVVRSGFARRNACLRRVPGRGNCALFGHGRNVPFRTARLRLSGYE